TVSMIDVIEGRTPAGLFKDKIVLIGAPTIGLSDVIATPFDPVLPSVELHANVIDNVLHERYLFRQAGQEALDFEIIIGFGILLGYILLRLQATRYLDCSALMLAAFASLNVLALI